MTYLSEDKIRERVILLRRFLPHLEWDWPNDVRERVCREVFAGRIPSNIPIRIDEIARIISDSQLEKLIHISPLKNYYSFRGKYYTVRREGAFEYRGSWDEVGNAVKEILKKHGKKGYALLKALVDVSEAPFDVIAVRASEIYGDRFYPSRLIAELRDVWDLVWEVGSRQYPR